MQILKNFFKISLISSFLYPNQIVLADEEEQRLIKWEVIKNYPTKKNEVKWEKLDQDTIFLEKKSEQEIDFSNKNLQKLENEELEQNLTHLGISVPTAHTLKGGGWNLYGDQVFPRSEGEAGGSANQNYSIFFNYGLDQDSMVSAFFVITDDPLHKRIEGFDTSITNLWINLGSSFKRRIYDGEKFNFSIDSAIEYWKVKSGGCNAGIGDAGSGCAVDSPNIFNNAIEPVVNNNLIGSLSLPFTYDFSKSFSISLVPKVAFLPVSQGNQFGVGEFYGTNVGLGMGFSYMPQRKLKTYSSVYIPIDGKNSFNQKLIFEKKIVSTLGFNYKFDTKTAFEGYITNSYGSSPSTSTLTLPSSNEILIGSRFIYTPSGFFYKNREDLIKRDLLITSNLSVNNTFLLGYGRILSDLNVSGGGSFWKRLKFGISDKFDLDISWETFSNLDEGINQFESKYLTPSAHAARIGGKVLLQGSNQNNSINTALRLSLGRKVFSDNWNGYFFSELINSYHFNDNLSFNVNPKVATAEENVSGLGFSTNLKILKGLSLRAEYNKAIENAEDNSTFVIRKSIKDSQFFDIYTSNAYGLIDMGQLQKSSSQKYGIRFGKFF